MTISVLVNGQEQSVEEGSTLTGLLTGLGIQMDHVAVELNLEVIEKKEYPKTRLQEGDKVEIIRFVGGGKGA